jgi:hypothetical protein
MKKKRNKERKETEKQEGFSVFLLYIYIYIFFLRELGQLERVDSIGVDLVRLIWLG